LLSLRFGFQAKEKSIKALPRRHSGVQTRPLVPPLLTILHKSGILAFLKVLAVPSCPVTDWLIKEALSDAFSVMAYT